MHFLQNCLARTHCVVEHSIQLQWSVVLYFLWRMQGKLGYDFLEKVKVFKVFLNVSFSNVLLTKNLTSMTATKIAKPPTARFDSLVDPKIIRPEDSGWFIARCNVPMPLPTSIFQCLSLPGVWLLISVLIFVWYFLGLWLLLLIECLVYKVVTLYWSDTCL